MAPNTEISVNTASLGKQGEQLYDKNNSTGTNGQVLTADGAGAAVWQDNGNGSVTSVAVSGGTTGLTTSGGPITSSGTITVAGTLAIANGGTGQVTANAALNALLPSQTGASGKQLQSDGTNTSWVLDPAAVTSFTSNTGLSTNVAATGAVTVTNTGVTSVAGTTNRLTASASTGAATLDISASYVGQASITTVGTITTGTWTTSTVVTSRGLAVVEGVNAKMGVATLSSGTVVVSTTAITANTRVFLTVQSLGTVAVPTPVYPSARTPGTSFTISSASVTDTSVVAWILVEPA